eukprot:scaffold75194_cov54-Phaeocystis_antarctica.AAC.1
MVKVQSGQRPSSAPVPPLGAPGGSGQLSTPRERPALLAPSHCLRCSSEPPPKPPIPPPLTIQAGAGDGALSWRPRVQARGRDLHAGGQVLRRHGGGRHTRAGVGRCPS